MKHPPLSIRPLSGKTLVVTRPEHQAGVLAEKITALGGQALLWPAIRILEGELSDELVADLERLPSFEWIILTSKNGVDALFAAMKGCSVPKEELAYAKIAVIGPGTALALRGYGVEPTVLPDSFISESIPEKLGDVKGKRILLPRADIARKALAKELRARGAILHERDIYKIALNDSAELIQEISQRACNSAPHYFTFTSSSTVRGLFGLLQAAGKEAWFSEVPGVCIGPITAETLVKLGGREGVVAATYTIDGMMEALLLYEASLSQEKI